MIGSPFGSLAAALTVNVEPATTLPLFGTVIELNVGGVLTPAAPAEPPYALAIA